MNYAEDFPIYNHYRMHLPLCEQKNDLLQSVNRKQSQQSNEKRLHMHTQIIISQVCPFDDGLDNLQYICQPVSLKD